MRKKLRVLTFILLLAAVFGGAAYGVSSVSKEIKINTYSNFKIIVDGAEMDFTKDAFFITI